MPNENVEKALLLVVLSPCARCGNTQQCGSPSASLSYANDVSVACPISSSYPYLVEPIAKDRRYNFLCTADSNVLPPPNPGTVYWSYNEPTNETGYGATYCNYSTLPHTPSRWSARYTTSRLCPDWVEVKRCCPLYRENCTVCL